MHNTFLNIHQVTQREGDTGLAAFMDHCPFTDTNKPVSWSRHHALRPFPREVLNGALNVEPGSCGGWELFVRLFNIFLVPFSGLENKNTFICALLCQLSWAWGNARKAYTVRRTIISIKGRLSRLPGLPGKDQGQGAAALQHVLRP